LKRKTIFAAVAALLAVGPPSFANGLNLNGLGARAAAMGGAYVGLANDFSSVYWNPAGLAQIKSRTFGFYGTDIMPSGSYNLTPAFPGSGPLTLVDAKTSVKHYLGFLACYIHPITSDLVAAIGVYTPSGLGSMWNGEDMGNISGGSQTLDWSSKVGLITIAPSIAYKISDRLSIGASLNINYGMFDLAMYAGKVPEALLPNADLGQYSESETGWGLGATIGLQFKPSEMISIGAVLRTASQVSFSGQAEMSNLQLLGFSSTSDMERTVTWPMWLAAGVAFRPLDALILTADLQYTNWKKIDRIRTTYTDTIWNLLMTSSGKDVMPLLWRDAVQIRVGAEYRLSPGFVLRGGYYSDPSPAPDQTLNILLPSYDFNGLTIGAGYQTGGLSLDFGLEVLLGRQRSVDYFKTLTDPSWTAMPGVYKMTIIVPAFSVGYNF
jgi:long-chain fatty acid transport protein